MTCSTRSGLSGIEEYREQAIETAPRERAQKIECRSGIEEYREQAIETTSLVTHPGTIGGSGIEEYREQAIETLVLGETTDTAFCVA